MPKTFGFVIIVLTGKGSLGYGNSEGLALWLMYLGLQG